MKMYGIIMIHRRISDNIRYVEECIGRNGGINPGIICEEWEL